MKQTLLLFLCGGVGSLCRFWLGPAVQRLIGTGFPIGTFVVNLIGCLIFGLIWALADTRKLISDDTRMIILSGFVGAFTTFSTFAFETEALLRDAHWLAALANILGQVVLGIIAVSAGIALGRLL